MTLDYDDCLKAICGIDPGKNGGVCFLAPDTGAVLKLIPMPGMCELADILDAAMPRSVFLEKAQSMPKQGISSAFNYGEHFGIIQGILIALELKHTLITPREWTKEMWRGVASKLKPKAKSLIAAQRMFPGVNLLATAKSKVPHDGLVDALLIAHYGRIFIERGQSKTGHQVAPGSSGGDDSAHYEDDVDSSAS